MSPSPTKTNKVEPRSPLIKMFPIIILLTDFKIINPRLYFLQDWPLAILPWRLVPPLFGLKNRMDLGRKKAQGNIIPSFKTMEDSSMG